MGVVTDKIWAALTCMIKLEDKARRQSEAIKAQQQKIEDLTARVIRLEAYLEAMDRTKRARQIKG